jgi:hypothetical protein
MVNLMVNWKMIAKTMLINLETVSKLQVLSGNCKQIARIDGIYTSLMVLTNTVFYDILYTDSYKFLTNNN